MTAPYIRAGKVNWIAKGSDVGVQERTLGPGHLETATTLRELAELLRFSGDYGAARPVFEKALVIRRSILGGDSLEVADVIAGMSVLLRRVGISRDASSWGPPAPV